MKIKTSVEFEGDTEDAPAWAKQSVAAWHRRLLMHPTTTYLVVVIGIATSASLPRALLTTILLIPSFMLTFHLAYAANRKWYEDRFSEHAPEI